MDKKHGQLRSANANASKAGVVAGIAAVAVVGNAAAVNAINVAGRIGFLGDSVK